MKPPDRRLEDIARAFLWERDRIEDEYASRPPRPIPFNNTLLTPSSACNCRNSRRATMTSPWPKRSPTPTANPCASAKPSRRGSTRSNSDDLRPLSRPSTSS